MKYALSTRDRAARQASLVREGEKSPDSAMWLDIDPQSRGEATPARGTEKGVTGWPPLSGLSQVLVVVVARGCRRPPQLEALAAIDRLVRARLERDFRVPAAFRADRGKHLARSAGVAPTATG